VTADLLSLSWPAAATLIGITVAVAGGIYKIIPSKDREWKDALEKLDKRLDKRISTLELNYPNIRQQLEDLKTHLGGHEGDVRSEIDKLDKKIQKLTDLLIDLVSGKR